MSAGGVGGGSSPFVLANSHLNPRVNRQKSPICTAGKKNVHPQPKNNYLGGIDGYPIFQHMRLSHYGFRPKKMKPDQLSELIEELYSDRYEVEMQNIRAAVNKILEEEDIRREIRDFNEFLYDFFLRRYHGNARKAEETIVSVLDTLDFYKNEYPHLQIFSEFMKYVYSPDDISCFLLIRSLIERELGTRIVSLDKKTILDLTKIALTKKQAKRVFEQFMVDEPRALVEKSFSRFVTTNLRTYNSEMIKPYEIMIHGVKEYKQLAEHKLASNLRSNSTHQSYIDSCLNNASNAASKKLHPTNTMLTFGGAERVKNHQIDLDNVASFGGNNYDQSGADQPLKSRDLNIQSLWPTQQPWGSNLPNSMPSSDRESVGFKQPIEEKVNPSVPTFRFNKLNQENSKSHNLTDNSATAKQVDYYLKQSTFAKTPQDHRETSHSPVQRSDQGRQPQVPHLANLPKPKQDINWHSDEDNNAHFEGFAHTFRNDSVQERSAGLEKIAFEHNTKSVSSAAPQHDQNYNTVCTLSQHCFNTLKHIINM
jgi:hypothetical protein